MNARQAETGDVAGVLRSEDTLHDGAVRQAGGGFLAFGRGFEEEQQQQ
jgi:hypothetical protein